MAVAWRRWLAAAAMAAAAMAAAAMVAAFSYNAFRRRRRACTLTYRNTAGLSPPQRCCTLTYRNTQAYPPRSASSSATCASTRFSPSAPRLHSNVPQHSGLSPPQRCPRVRHVRLASAILAGSSEPSTLVAKSFSARPRVIVPAASLRVNSSKVSSLLESSDTRSPLSTLIGCTMHEMQQNVN